MVPDAPLTGSFDPVSHGEPRAAVLLARARELAPVVEAHARESEDAGTLAPNVVEAIRESGLLLAFLPEELGGHALPPSAIVTLVEEVARQDGSTGWCFGMNGLITGVCAAGLPDEGIDRLFGSGPASKPERLLIAGGFPPMGRADRESDGWRVSGHFKFGSGILHADHACCTVVEFEGDTPVMDGAIPRMRTFVVPRDEVRVTRNWDVAGLQATGSCDYHLDDQWLPDCLSFISSHLEARRGRALFGLPLLTIANAPHSGFALGVGRRALEEITSHAAGRRRLASASPLANRASFQRDYARARTRLAAAHALVTDRFDALERARDRDGGIQIEDRAELTAATTNAYEAALDAATTAFRAAGGAALHRDGLLQRCFRDIQAGAQHIVVSDESWERVAQLWLGVGTPGMI